MNTRHDDQERERFERQARQAFDASVDALDAATTSRLNQARQHALAAAQARGQRRWWSAGWPGGWRNGSWLMPAGALAAAVLAAALLLRAPTEGLTTSPEGNPVAASGATPAQEPLEMLAADEDFDLATSEEDLEFYAWVDQAAAAQANGSG